MSRCYRRIDDMKWVEIITVRSYGKINRQLVNEVLDRIPDPDSSTGGTDVKMKKEAKAGDKVMVKYMEKYGKIVAKPLEMKAAKKTEKKEAPKREEAKPAPAPQPPLHRLLHCKEVTKPISQERAPPP
jgi:hypothetical protein